MAWRSILLPLVLSAVSVSCNSASSTDTGGSPTQRAGELPDAPSMTVAEGWEKFSMIANWAQTDVDTLAHFKTSRNACGKEETGSLELDLWNRLASALNAAAKASQLPEEYCLPMAEARRVMDGVADLVLPSGKLELFWTRGPEVCTKISDRAVAQQLLLLLDQVVSIADLEGCPNGWGS